MILDYKKTDSRAIVPTRGSKFAAGYDLYAIEYKLLAPGEKYKFRTGLAIELPPGYFGAIKSRSGVSWKQDLDIVGSAGTIDEDYRGEITVPLWNTGNEEQFIEAGQRIAQLVIEKYTEVDWREVNELHPSERGDGGFGSTGA